MTETIDTLREKVEQQRLLVEQSRLQKQLSLLEATSIYGTPVDFYRENLFRGQPLGYPYNPAVPEQRKDRTVVIRTMQDLDYYRAQADALVEVDPCASGLLRGLTSYVLGKGSDVKVQGKDDQDPPVRLAKSVNDLINLWQKHTQWAILERELFSRLHAQGELFLRFLPDEDGVTKIDVIEPGDIRPPREEQQDGPWSFGLYTPYRSSLVEAYNIHHWADHTDEEVEPQFMIHQKVNVKRNQKRGLSSFLACEEELRGATKLRWATREGEKIRASLAYLREHATAPFAAASALQQSLVTDTFTAFTSQGAQDVDVQQIYPGSIHDVPAGLKYVPPPGSPNSPGASEAVKKSLEAAAARFQAPYWLISGDSTASSYASSLTAESPFVREIVAQQSLLGLLFLLVYTKVIEIAVEQDLLPDDTLEKIDLHVEFPSPVVRNASDETARYERLHNNRVMSRSTWATREDLDDEKEQQNLSEELPAGIVGERAVAAPSSPETAAGQLQRDQGRVS